MSTSALTNDIVEELVSNAVGDVPVAKDIWIISNKCFSTRKLRGTIKDGRANLYEGGKLLCKPDVKTALEGREMYQGLCDTYFELEAVAKDLEQQIKSVKYYQLNKKYTIHVRAARWNADSYEYMVSVRENSTSARLGPPTHHGVLPTAIGTPHVTMIGDAAHETGNLESASTLTLVAGDSRDAAHDEEDSAGTHSHAEFTIEFSDTHSVFGNHWAEHEVDSESPSTCGTVSQPGASIH